MQKVIIDCDPEIDDVLALMLAVQTPNLDVVAITVVSGNVPADLGVQNVIKCLEFCDRLDIPIYKGANGPLKRAYVSAQDTHGQDGLGESHIKVTSNKQAERLDAATFLAQTFQTPQSIGVIALGPLTNIAQALIANQNIGQNLNRFVSMGGTYQAAGNCSPVAEYNYWCDPDAAQYVYAHLDHRIEMIGLDVTRQIVLSPDILTYCQYMNAQVGQFIGAITHFYFDFHWQQERILGCVINDPLAVAYFSDPTLCSGFSTYVDVATTGIALGQTLVDVNNFYQRDANARVLTQVNAPAFFEQFLTTVLHLEPAQVSSDVQRFAMGASK
ncbi:iunH3 protein [Agrilactobacillus composti DSM 18527 = JCM 14202]|uniref:IunH3 protein n=1 Tax=Agrilactobacillus composti DSM 18527 = JCM 14202 TaxID=1423734 RepID=X0PCU5_9LACO|nr:nucleoside hydrolase [Agrilactobacillus composti]KRM30519.1 iunH3 protein [Agrilactobacillus composti DSM 18527 = JCM 14202]GAF38418.1 preQ1-regulated inosine-uridine nucleoside hydrolase [Agrilactobacillus composti DSM 18527 = JCM 14202]